jgi:hypothetical protein
MYRAAALTQRDGSAFANANCGCTSAAVGLDHHTAGRKLSTGADMRERNPDQEGGTDWHDMAAAWATYGETLQVRNGYEWSDAVADLRAGRMVLLSVWHEATGQTCLSGDGGYGHGMAVAPETNGTSWLTNDPWCKPGIWDWIPESDLRRGAEEFGAQVYGRDVAGPEARAIPAEIIRRIVKGLLNRRFPEEES